MDTSSEMIAITTSNSISVKPRFPQQRDMLGVIYQGLRTEGRKSQEGSYYTPARTVSRIVNRKRWSHA